MGADKRLTVRSRVQRVGSLLIVLDSASVGSFLVLSEAIEGDSNGPE